MTINTNGPLLRNAVIYVFILDLNNRCAAKLRQIGAESTKCLTTVFEFIPLSGKTFNKLEELETDKYGIENFGSVEPVFSNVSGVKRQFDVNMYGIFEVRDLLTKFLFFALRF